MIFHFSESSNLHYSPQPLDLYPLILHLSNCSTGATKTSELAPSLTSHWSNASVLPIFLLRLTGTCPDGWIRFSDSCYWVEQHKQSFAEAEKRCYEKNATLFVVNSQDEWDAVREHFPQIGYTWIGLVRFTHRERSEDTPTWQTEGAVNPAKLNWLIRPYKPVSNGWSILSNCAAHYSASLNLDASAYTYYQPCSFKYYSICERNSTILDFLNRKFDIQA
ncbi:CRE-CLEC-266 protein [Caenorhabditis remanei]|uniref:CRE-CLEC-266 protein n=1 Tax=Caenorhabditis remanei TaxID=31234 RepID=E3LDF1_CAERE|nr:CRE-CLEC-266 protein [Caenorhabditis remanei]